ncbi:Na+/Ca+ antiporter, CaCA family [Desulfobulbus propionicus DSM 2032]|uniref:Na+/Ca+ antiporter, CaCA family n=1 Tax=Desulfobulbus propionicus (strain ATCC 33891 / DSM 2032 / VKM B-1956 / 1pr3) TaxID=577650 RepID=A0A7U3YIW6_DESPD|nr:sodium:calcium antiporter [Desulfobulbus propionicus]ADW16251.1 Na+/Ca+ antiporter, CaCA family [Desulfobulbus propionicus DSM 2032]
MNDYLSLTVGIACAGVGGELFVRGAVGLAHWARIPPGIIGAVVAAFATSSPELSVSISSALAGNPQIALGDALGSNIVNIALLVPLLTGLLFFDGQLSRLDGLLMLVLFFSWLALAMIEAKKQRSATDEILGEHRKGLVVGSSVAGLVLLVLAGDLIVTGAKGIALSFGMDYFLVGVTIVAIGTSAPELATAVIAKLRGHDEVGLGTILGSNIFNGLLIVPVAAVIEPIAVVARHEVALSLAAGFMAVLLPYPTRTGYIQRSRGVLLLLFYGGYVYTLLALRGT